MEREWNKKLGEKLVEEEIHGKIVNKNEGA